MDERRKSKRLGLKANMLINPLGSNQEPESVNIEIVDLSSDGIGFSCEKSLTKGNNYEATLTIWNKDTIHVFLQIVRVAELDNGYNYGAIFIGMPDSDRQRIAVYETITDMTDDKK